jgi:hypothetical protein
MAKPRYSFEDRTEHQAKLGALRPEILAETIKRIGDYEAKAKDLSSKHDQTYKNAPRDTAWHGEADRVRTVAIYDDVLAKLERIEQEQKAWLAKAARLRTIPQVAAALARGRS